MVFQVDMVALYERDALLCHTCANSEGKLQTSSNADPSLA